MKTNILKLSFGVVLIILLVALMPKTTFAATTVNRIDITIQNPLIGNALSTDWQVTAEGVDPSKIIAHSIVWLSEDTLDLLNDIAEYDKKYRASLTIKLSKDYVLANDCKVYINGIEAIIESYVDYPDPDYDIIHLFSDPLQSIQKEISTIDIVTPTPIVGEKLSTDISKFEVKINSTEILSVRKVTWLSEDLQSLTSDIAELGKKYDLQIGFNVPNTYGMNRNVVITVNGEKLDYPDMASGAFNFATSGDNNFNYAFVSKLVEVKEEVTEEANETAKDDGNEETPKNEKETKNPKTGDTITKTCIISIIAILGIAFTINSIRKQNR